MKHYLGIDIGGTFIKYAIINETYEIIQKWKKETIRYDNKDDFYDYLCLNLPNLDTIESIGVSAPGIIDHDSTILSYAADNVLIMYHTNVNYEIHQRTNKHITTMNDAKAAGYCEFKLGNGKNTKSSIYYVIGTGIGGCVCDANGVVDGQDHLVGEFSFLPVGWENNEAMRMHTLDASMDALIQQYNLLAPTKQVKLGTAIAERFLNQEQEAVMAIDAWLNHICLGLMMLTILYNPEIICIGGGISEEDWFIQSIQQRYQEHCERHFKGSVVSTKVNRCLYHSTANVIGAVAYAIESR